MNEILLKPMKSVNCRWWWVLGLMACLNVWTARAAINTGPAKGGAGGAGGIVTNGLVGVGATSGTNALSIGPDSLNYTSGPTALNVSTQTFFFNGSAQIGGVTIGTANSGVVSPNWHIVSSNGAAANGSYVIMQTNGQVHATSNIDVGYGGAAFYGLSQLTNAAGLLLGTGGGIATNQGTGQNNVLTNLTVVPGGNTTIALTISNLAGSTANAVSLFSFTNLAAFYFDAGLGQHLRSTNAGWFTYFNTQTNPVYQLTNSGVPTLTSSNLAEWRTNAPNLTFTNLSAAGQYFTILNGTNVIFSGNLNVGQQLQVAGQSFLSNSIVVTSGGADITGVITNESGTFFPTNVSGTGAYTVGLHYGTNFAAAFTLAAFAGVPVNKEWDLWMYGTNSAAAVSRATFPNGVTGCYNNTNLSGHFDFGAGKDADIDFHGYGTMKTNAIIFPRSL